MRYAQLPLLPPAGSQYEVYLAVAADTRAQTSALQRLASVDRAQAALTCQQRLDARSSTTGQNHDLNLAERRLRGDLNSSSERVAVESYDTPYGSMRSSTRLRSKLANPR